MEVGDKYSHMGKSIYYCNFYINVQKMFFTREEAEKMQIKHKEANNVIDTKISMLTKPKL